MSLRFIFESRKVQLDLLAVLSVKLLFIYLFIYTYYILYNIQDFPWTIGLRIHEVLHPGQALLDGAMLEDEKAWEADLVHPRRRACRQAGTLAANMVSAGQNRKLDAAGNTPPAQGGRSSNRGGHTTWHGHHSGRQEHRNLGGGKGRGIRRGHREDCFRLRPLDAPCYLLFGRVLHYWVKFRAVLKSR